jgi:hypothetical protein
LLVHRAVMIPDSSTKNTKEKPEAHEVLNH